MLADPRSEALVSNFAQQLLYLRNLPATSPDGIFYPNWDDELRQGLKRESELFFDSIIREDRNIVELLTADYTFVNERLARHYGIPNVYGSRFRRVTLPPAMDYRRGLLGKGSFLAVTWTQNFRSSPVKRGVWVLENILGTPPPEPPPNVPALEDTKSEDGKALTLREQMTLHRSSPPCAGCHKIMDPIGFALENFDADASWRAKQGGEGGMPIDARVTLFDGQDVDGPVGVAGGASALLAAVRADVRREDDDLRDRPRARVHGHADGPRDCARGRTGRQSVLGDRAGGRQERAVPDEDEGGNKCSSRKSTSHGGRSCAARA